MKTFLSVVLSVGVIGLAAWTLSAPATPTVDSSVEKVAVAVHGEAFNIEEIVVPGHVTIIEFGADW